MILGNTSGKNKGKKYLKKNNKIDAVFAEQANDFSEWFEQRYTYIVSFLSGKNIFDSDALSDTYLNVYENILFSGLMIENYESYLFRSYYTNLINDKAKQNRFVELPPTIEKEDMDFVCFSEEEERQQKLESDIMIYVYSNYNLRDFELFKMYMYLKPAINYSTLAKITGLKSYNIQRKISKIKKSIRSNPDLMKQRKELI